MTTTLTITQEPIGLVEVIRDYGVEELGGLFVYLPLPHNSADQAAWAWVETAHLAGVIRSGPWRVDASRISKWIQVLHPKLVMNNPLFFQVFRLDRDRLTALINKIGSVSGS